MKKFIVFALLLIISSTSFSQPVTNTVLTGKTDYLKKSRSQKTTAWFLIGGGMVLITIAGSIQANEHATDLSNIFSLSGEQRKYTPTADILGYTGLACMLGSIPLFIGAHKNKKKAMSLSFKNETVPQILKNSFEKKFVPSLTLKISV